MVAEPVPRVVVIGASGRIGTVCATALHANGVEVVPMSVRLPPSSCPSRPRELSDFTEAVHRMDDLTERLGSQLGGAYGVVNAAGVAAPTSGVTAEMWNANSLLPSVLLLAARRAGVETLVHVSSAAVQGRMEPLDESDAMRPVSDYAVTKAVGEAVLRRTVKEGSSPRFVIYRPGSVHSRREAKTEEFGRRLQQLGRTGLGVPLVDDGACPLPVVAASNVGRAVTELVFGDYAGVVVHPFEGWTARTFVRTLAPDARIRSLTPTQAAALLGALRAVAPRSQHVRRAETLILGQSVRAHQGDRLLCSLQPGVLE